MIGDEDIAAPAAEPVASPPSDTAAPGAELDLDALVAEYSAQTGSREQQRPGAQDQQPVERDHGADLREMMQSGRDVLELQLRVRDLQEESLARREHEDREEAFAQAQTYLEGLEHLPEDFARRWLIAEANLDPELNRAWHNRYEDHDALRRCTATLRRSFNKMRAEASRMADPGATADRAAVVEAINRGRSSGPVEAKAPDLSKMSDQEFAKYKETIGL